jgi:hypothetical protein
MKRLVPVLAAAVVFAACQDSNITTPPDSAVPSGAISDGAHGGNLHFFFLPPIVDEPDPEGEFNPGLGPVVQICELTMEPGPSDPSDDVCGTIVFEERAEKGSSDYHVNWKTGESNNVFANELYRIRVLLGLRELGYRDMDPVDSPNEIPSNPASEPFYAFLNGNNQPIKFIIEKGALCDPSVPLELCGEVTVDLAQGGGVQVQNGAVNVPAQSSGDDATLVFQPCTGTGEVDIDLPKFGECVEIKSLNGQISLDAAAIISVCDLATPGLSAAQRGLLHLHQQTEIDGEEVVLALPNVEDECESSVAMSNEGGPLRFVRDGWRTVTDGLAGVFGPREAIASAAVLHKGGGGSTKTLGSKFQFALPAKMVKVAATDDQVAPAGQPVALPPAVHVTDIMNRDVANATVTFSVASGGGNIGSTDPLQVTTNLSGMAAVPTWVLGDPGLNELDASGVGIAVIGNDGPRSTFDPFQPIESSTPSADDAVVLGEGTVTFEATACVPGGGVGTAQIDGALSAGEWDCAISDDFDANLSGGSSADATVYWMNDNNYLYIAVRIARDKEDKVNLVGIDFNSNGIAEVGNDVLIVDGNEPAGEQFRDMYLTQKCINRGQSACGIADPEDPLGDGAFDFDAANGFAVYEFQQALDSGEQVNEVSVDIAVSTGIDDTVGFFLTVRLGKGAQGNTQHPDFREYIEVTIQ